MDNVKAAQALLLVAKSLVAAMSPEFRESMKHLNAFDSALENFKDKYDALAKNASNTGGVNGVPSGDSTAKDAKVIADHLGNLNDLMLDVWANFEVLNAMETKFKQDHPEI